MLKRLCGFLASGAVVVAAGLLSAQDRTNPNIQSEGGKVKPGQTSDRNESDGATSTQNQRGTGTTQRGQSQTGSSRAGQSHRGQQSAGMSESVDQYIATCLTNKNQGEIELSKLAQQRAESQEVKQFAAQMVKDHTAFVEKLRTAQGDNQGAAGQHGQRSGQSGTSTQSGSSRTNRLGQSGAGSSSESGSQGSSSQGSGSSASSQNSSSQNSSSNDASDTRNQSTRIRLGQGTRSNAAAGASSDSIPVQTLVSVDNDIHERVMQAMKQELEQKQGREFDKAFMGAQCQMHLVMVNTLEALQNHVSQDLQQTLRQGAETSKQHLTQAKQIKEQIEGKSGAAQTNKERDDKTSRRREPQNR